MVRFVKMEYRVLREKMKEYSKIYAKYYGNIFGKNNNLAQLRAKVSVPFFHRSLCFRFLQTMFKIFHSKFQISASMNCRVEQQQATMGCPRV